jgi:dipeptidyl aminopeptidase/acylaminoacyl peptidase
LGSQKPQPGGIMKAHAMLAGLIWLSAASSTFAAEGKRLMKVDDLFRFQRVSDPQIGPDGKTVVYAVASVDLSANKTTTSLWLAPTAEGAPRQLTNPGPGKKDKHPRWSPDGKQILFESNRSGDNQLWLIDLAGGEARQMTNIATEAGTGIWSPDGKSIAFVSTVWPEYSEKPYAASNELNKKRKEEAEKNPVKAKVFSKLFFRHWDEYVEDKRKHLFVIAAAGPQGAGFAEPRDVTPGDRDAYPTSSTFSVGDDFTFSPDSKYLLYTAVPERDEAWSTNFDICRVPITGGKVENLTKDNPAADSAPRFSPDGKRLAYRAQKRAGFEADKWELMVVDTNSSGAFTGKPRSVTAGCDRSVQSFGWLSHGILFFTAEDNGNVSVFTVTAAPGGKVENFVEGNHNSAVSVGRGAIAFLRAAMNHPPEVYVHRGVRDPMNKNGPDVIEIIGKEDNLSHTNDKLLAELNLPRPESVKVKVEGTEMQMWILKPPGFDPKKKWPLVYLVHGGPQGAWEDGWSFRWNPELWAAQGYVIALPNPRGSTGFGQKFVDEISGDWGGKCFDDLMKGVEYVEKLPYVDKDRMASAGASFGGYMMNWFQGHTTKFKTLISHCGVYNLESMWGTTEELWFDEWEHGGLPWDKPEAYRKHSPHLHAKNFKTPMLIIHNDLDFRVPVGEGIQMFTTLQRLRIPSKLINFPDEGHWVQKPANSKFWHEQVFAWLTKYVPAGPK